METIRKTGASIARIAVSAGSPGVSSSFDPSPAHGSYRGEWIWTG